MVAAESCLQGDTYETPKNHHRSQSGHRQLQKSDGSRIRVRKRDINQRKLTDKIKVEFRRHKYLCVCIHVMNPLTPQVWRQKDVSRT